MDKKITIKKIAEIAGVSGATVSKVLNNNGRYTEETRRKILKIVDEYNYRPNAMAKSLRTNKSETIGIIVPDITNEFFAQVVLAIEKYCDPLGYSVFICNTGENEEKELQYFSKLEQKGVDGIIYLSGSDQLLQMNTQLPIVCIDRIPKLQNAMVVTSDNFHGGYLAASKLLESKCETILLMRDYRDGYHMNEREAGFQKALADHGIKNSMIDVVKLEVGIEQGKQTISDLIEQGRFSFDGIFATTDGLAFGAILALEEHGYTIPQDVKVVGYDNVSLATYNQITSINQNKQMLGEHAVELLLNMIENGSPATMNDFITIPVELIERKSTWTNYKQ